MKKLFVSTALILISTFCLAQAKWNCGIKGAANVVASFDGTTQTLTISGKGEMGDSPWENLKEAINIVKITQGVTIITSFAFGKTPFPNDPGYANLETVIIANSVTRIDGHAFSGATNLRKIYIPNSVSYIDNGAFQESGIESISLPYSVKDIGELIFNGCGALKTVNLSKTQISNIKRYSFEDCSQLEDIQLPPKLKEIGIGVFNGCSALKSITCYTSTPPTIFSAFRNVDLSQITLYVPEASITIYKYSDVWKEFGKIEAISKSSTK